MSAKKVFIKSYGCQMNVYDSNRMLDSLVTEGYVPTDRPEDAAVVILNTCHIREKAAEKVYSELGRLRKEKLERAKTEHPLQIAVTGCVAQAEGAEIQRRQPAVDFVVGPQSYHRLGTMLGASGTDAVSVDTEFPIDAKFMHLPRPPKEMIKSRGYTAFVTVQEGCDKFCTFCVVPYTRGAEMSRTVKEIIEEITILADSHVKEVTLIGQNVNAYHGEADNGKIASLADLIEAVAEIENIKRIRYTTSHPRDMSGDLIRLHGSCDKLMPYLHLPVQSGSDLILDRMNRKHTADDYREIITRVRKSRPDIAISSDFIVGFPGETESDFLETVKLVEDIQFASAYSFNYSRRPGTTGADLNDDVPSSEKSRRLHYLQATLDAQRKAYNENCIGKTVPVLFEKEGRHSGQIVGKTPYLQTIQVEDEKSLIGVIEEVHITKNGSNSLFGRLNGPKGWNSIPFEDRSMSSPLRRSEKRVRNEG